MTLTSLHLKGFRRYVDETFTLGPGLTVIDGDNDAGKTTLFFAIEYALFGSALGMKSTSALLRPGAKALGVELAFTGKDGAPYVLSRTHQAAGKGKAKLTGHFTLAKAAGDVVASSDHGDTEEKLQLALTALLGVTRRVFDLAVHVRQGEIAAVLEGDVKLDIALGITAAAAGADEAKALANEDDAAASSLDTLRESLAHVERERADLAADDSAAQAALAALEERAHAARALLEEAHAGAADHDEDRDRADDEPPEHKAGSASADLIHSRADLEGRIARRERVLQKASAEGALTCEHCGSEIDVHVAKRELEEWQREKRTLDEVWALAEKKRAAERERREAAREKTRAAAQERMRAVAKAEADLAVVEEQLEAQRAQLENKAERLGASEAELERLRAAIAAVDERARRAARLRKLAAALKALQEELRKEAAAALAQDTLAIHRALAGDDPAGITGITIDPVRYQLLVTSAAAGEDVPAVVVEGGGHKLLLGLAFRLALGKRLGPLPFLLLDEPTYGLDKARRAQLLARLATLSPSPQTLVITHHAEAHAGARIVVARVDAASSARVAA